MWYRRCGLATIAAGFGSGESGSHPGSTQFPVILGKSLNFSMPKKCVTYSGAHEKRFSALRPDLHYINHKKQAVNPSR